MGQSSSVIMVAINDQWIQLLQPAAARLVGLRAGGRSPWNVPLLANKHETFSLTNTNARPPRKEPLAVAGRLHADSSVLR
jgi:hypothetical protein